jgi:hypothetical protein
LLRDPPRLFADFEAFCHVAREEDEDETAEQHHIARRLDRVTREERRLPMPTGLWRSRAPSLLNAVPICRKDVTSSAKQEHAKPLRCDRFRGPDVRLNVTAFCESVSSRLADHV